MSADNNVSPIRPLAGSKPGSSPTKPRRTRRPPPGVHLAESDEGDGFSTLDVVNGLHGVCVALDTYVVTNSCPDVDQAAELSMAAKVLSSILQRRVH